MRFEEISPSTLAGRGSRENHSDPEFWLLFNALGEISYCSPLLAQLLGRDAADMRGTAVRSLLPALPVNGKTPGYNVAALTMGHPNRRHSLQLLIADGASLPVEASITSTRLGSGPVFIVELSSPGRMAIVESDG